MNWQVDGEYRGSDFTAAITLGNPDVLVGSGERRRAGGQSHSRPSLTGKPSPSPHLRCAIREMGSGRRGSETSGGTALWVRKQVCAPPPASSRSRAGSGTSVGVGFLACEVGLLTGSLSRSREFTRVECIKGSQAHNDGVEELSCPHCCG